MNKSFRIVFNKARKALMVVSEEVKSWHKVSSSTVTVRDEPVCVRGGGGNCNLNLLKLLSISLLALSPFCASAEIILVSNGLVKPIFLNPQATTADSAIDFIDKDLATSKNKSIPVGLKANVYKDQLEGLVVSDIEKPIYENGEKYVDDQKEIIKKFQGTAEIVGTTDHNFGIYGLNEIKLTVNAENLNINIENSKDSYSLKSLNDSVVTIETGRLSLKTESEKQAYGILGMRNGSVTVDALSYSVETNSSLVPASNKETTAGIFTESSEIRLNSDKFSEGITLNTTGKVNTYGIYGSESEVSANANSLMLTTKSSEKDAIGICANSSNFKINFLNSDIENTEENKIKLVTQSEKGFAQGIYANTTNDLKNSSISIDGRNLFEIETVGEEFSHGIGSLNSSTITLGANKIRIRTTSKKDQANGIDSEGKSKVSLNANDIEIKTISESKEDGKFSSGIFANSGSEISINPKESESPAPSQFTLETISQSKAFGIISDESSVEVKNKDSISLVTKGDSYASGIEGNASKVELEAGKKIFLSSQGNVGSVVGINGKNNSSISIKAESVEVFSELHSGTASTGIHSESSQITISAKFVKLSAEGFGGSDVDARGIDGEGASGDISVKADNSLSIISKSKANAYGVHTFGSNVNLDAPSLNLRSSSEEGDAYGIFGSASRVKISGDKAEIISCGKGKGTTSLYAFGKQELNSTGKDVTEIVVDAKDIKIYAESDSNESIAAYAVGDDTAAIILVNSDALSGSDLGSTVRVKGDILAKAGNNSAKVFVNFGNQDSLFVGKSIYFPNPDKDIQINIGLSNSAQWFMTGSSYVTNFNAVRGKVFLGSNPEVFKTFAHDSKTVVEGKQLWIKNLVGNGDFYLRTDIASDSETTTDSIYVINGQGTHQLFVRSFGAEPAENKKEMKQYLVRDESGKASFTLGNEDGVVDAGVYLYELKSRDANGIDSQMGLDWYLARKITDSDNPEGFSPSAEAVLALSGMGVQSSLYQNQLSDVRKRLGEIRSGVADGLWLSFAGDKQRISGFAHTAFKQDTYRLNIGLDHLKSNWLLGGNFKYGNANQKTYHSKYHSKGDAHSEGLNLYATWRNEKGWYSDFVFSADRYHQRINTTMLDNQAIRGGYHNWGLGISAEGGRKITLGDKQEWFVEPQIQLSFYHVKGDKFSMSNGMEVHQDKFNSLTGRIGIATGKDMKRPDGSEKGQLYLRTGLKHEFLGKQKIRVNGIQFKDDLIGTRFYYGVGMDFRVDKNLKVYGHIERENGAHYTKEIEVLAGVKYCF